MTERELLEFAAKAAGFADFNPTPDSSGRYNVGPATKADGALDDGHWMMWNPLTDDGDALRLAVKLNFVMQCMGWCCSVTRGTSLSATELSEGEGVGAATRRAIFRAAAEIGKQMP